MNLLRCLAFLEAQYQLEFSCVHIPGICNDLADDLSHNRLSSFLNKVPEASRSPTPVSQLAHRPPHGHQQHLALTDLDQSVRFYCQQGIAESTQRTYKAGIKQFQGFCTLYQVYNPLPVTELLLCQFAAFLANQGLAPQTAKT